jgi:hypothetical protein
MNKTKVANNIRRHLERRVAFLLGVKVEELPKMKLGTLVHLMFLLKGDSEELGGFNTTMQGVLDLSGPENVWADQEQVVAEKDAAKIIN